MKLRQTNIWWVFVTFVLAATLVILAAMFVHGEETWPFPFKTGTEARSVWKGNVIKDCSGEPITLSVVEKEGIKYIVTSLDYNLVVFAQLKDEKETYFWIIYKITGDSEFFKVDRAMPANGMSICDILERERSFEEGERTTL